MRSAWAWIVAHPLGAVACYVAACTVLSSLWYAVRRGAWPGVETEKLPRWARIVQALVESLLNLPGALRAATGWPPLPPSSQPPPSQPRG